ncbi:9983_t:CDS:2 [Diversispora eburnea]|uniref:9983_t:CDS:1 n=1 Tax=Diversispora eburnea TaxID=1213867 RepID=A0A9N8ZAZ8_9GLOM|nr:9983_t:CDS:2 [Diversispora eburnea]
MQTAAKLPAKDYVKMAEIPFRYWKELTKGLPEENSIEIKRWSGENDKKSGLDLALIKIR